MSEPEQPVTPGERLLNALGQLYGLWHRHELNVAPIDFDVEDLARIIGVARDIEFVSHHPGVRCYHFPSEVLVVQEADPYPWRLLDLDTWSAFAEFVDLET